MRPATGSVAARRRTAMLIVAAVTFIAYLPVLRNGFVTWDDDRNFVENFEYRGLGWDNLRWMWTTFHMGHYVPLSWMTLGLDYQLWGMNAAGYHLTSLVLHCINAVLLFAIIHRLVGTARPESADTTALIEAAAVGALFFAIHPLRVESVAWATERRDVLSGTFYWLSILAYLRFAVQPGAGRRLYWASWLAFVCALLSKATSVTLPVVLLVLNAYPLRRVSLTRPDARRARSIAAELAPFFIAAAAVIPLTLVALKPPDQLAFPAKLAVSAYSLAFYVMKTLFPVALSPLYVMPPRLEPTEPRFLLSAALVIAAAGMLWARRKRWPALVTGAVIFTVVILPLLGVVQNGPQIAADRYTYHAAPALSVLAAAGLMLLSRAHLSAVRAASWTGLAVLAALTWRQTMVWHDPRTFWTYVLAHDERSAIAHTAVGTLRERDGLTAEAIEHYQRATVLDPAYAEAHDNLGVIYAKLGRHAEALQEFARAVAASPLNYESHGNLGVELAREERLDEAIAEYQRALAINPEYAAAHTNWGNALVRRGSLEEAIAHYREAARLRPDLSEAHLNWGVALAREGNFREAIVEFRAALAIDPGLTEARAYLARSLELANAPRPN